MHKQHGMKHREFENFKLHHVETGMHSYLKKRWHEQTFQILGLTTLATFVFGLFLR